MRPCFLLLALLAATAAVAQDRDLSKVEIKSTQLAPGLYLLSGSGGNITASVGKDGVLMVDDEFAALADRIRAALKSLAGADAPVRYVINTHYHFDHTDGNLPFAQAGAILIAQDHLRERMASGGTIGNGGSIARESKPAEPGALPQITFDHELTVHLNGEDVQVVHYPRAHTDGDSIVFFAKGNTVAMGDIFVRYGFPFIDTNGGGTVQGMIAACTDVLKRVTPAVKIVAGHGELAGVDDLRTYLKMLEDTNALVERGIASGKTLEQLKQAQLFAPWSERYAPQGAFVNADAYLESLYNSYPRHVARQRPVTH
jgi:cyclase